MEIEYAIVHDLQKLKGGQPTIKHREELLPKTEGLSTLFTNLHSLYHRKVTKGLGRFDKDTKTFRFSTFLDIFINSNNGQSFIDFTKASLNLLKDRIANENLATGGYLLFISYIENVDRFIFITILRQTTGCVINKDLDIDKAKHLEMDKLHIGCQIDISTWKNTPQNQYITFIKGRATQTTPQYFLKAIGCDEFANSALQTTELIRAINDFAEQEEYSKGKKQELKQIIFDYCTDRDNILLDSLSQIVSDNEPQKFLEFINQGDYKIGNGFEPHKTHLKKLKEIKASGEGIQLKFPASMLGTRIQLDENGNKVTINDPPESITRVLRDES
nr:nucleoid-associated protein [uncultured Desulfobacter sp.]